MKYTYAENLRRWNEDNLPCPEELFVAQLSRERIVSDEAIRRNGGSERLYKNGYWSRPIKVSNRGPRRRRIKVERVTHYMLGMYFLDISSGLPVKKRSAQRAEWYFLAIMERLSAMYEAQAVEVRGLGSL